MINRPYAPMPPKEPSKVIIKYTELARALSCFIVITQEMVGANVEIDRDQYDHADDELVVTRCEEVTNPDYEKELYLYNQANEKYLKDLEEYKKNLVIWHLAETERVIKEMSKNDQKI